MKNSKKITFLLILVSTFVSSVISIEERKVGGKVRTVIATLLIR